MEVAEFESVLRGAQGGGEWAWQKLYRWLAADVRGYIRARGAHSPDDVLGEVFVQLARHIATFRGDAAKFRSWVFVIAHHRVIDESRRRKADRSIACEPRELPDPPALATVEAEVLEAMSAGEVRSWLEAHLTEEQLEVLLLRVFGGLSAVDVAKALGKRPGAIRAVHHRALASLRRAAAEGGVTK